MGTHVYLERRLRNIQTLAEYAADYPHSGTAIDPLGAAYRITEKQQITSISDSPFHATPEHFCRRIFISYRQTI
jgi:hypothetical protein